MVAAQEACNQTPLGISAIAWDAIKLLRLGYAASPPFTYREATSKPDKVNPLLTYKLSAS
jgi:hypothetical protein